MRHSETAAARLSAGDAIRAQIASGTPLREAAAAAGMSHALARKVVWLAERFKASDRSQIGTEVLTALPSSLLEAVAALRDKRLRNSLLIAAHEEELSVRALRTRVTELKTRGAEDTPAEGQSYGGRDVMDSASRALTRYSSMPDSQLYKIISGPAGGHILGVLRAASTLASKLNLPYTSARTHDNTHNGDGEYAS